MDKKAYKHIKCNSFSKSDWNKNYIEILEQMEAELLIGLKELVLDIKNMVATIRPKE